MCPPVQPDQTAVVEPTAQTAAQPDTVTDPSPAEADAIMVAKPGNESNSNKDDAKVRSGTRRALFVITAICTFVLIGAPLSWGPMQLMLEHNGSYSDKCQSPEDLTRLAEDGVCPNQTNVLIRIAFIMNITQMASPALGLLVDKVGAPMFATILALASLLGMTLVAIAMHGQGTLDALLYTGFPIMSVCTWMGSLLIVQLGFYFQGHTASRVIFILNTLFDSGAMSYWVLWFVQDTSDSSVLPIWIAYIVVGCVLYVPFIWLWHKAVPEEPPVFDDSTEDSVSVNENQQDDHEEQTAGSATFQRRHSSRPSLVLVASRGSARLINTGGSSRSSFGGPLSPSGDISSTPFVPRASLSRNDAENASDPDVPPPRPTLLSAQRPSLLTAQQRPSLLMARSQSTMKLSVGKDGGMVKTTSLRYIGNGNYAEVSDQVAAGGGPIKAAPGVSFRVSKNAFLSGASSSRHLSSRFFDKSIDEGDEDNDEDAEEDMALSPSSQLTSPPFLCFLAFFSMQLMANNWNFSTQRDFLAYLGDDDYNNRYLTIFTLLCPVSILGAPFLDYSILHYGWTGTLQGINILGIVYTVVKISSNNLNVQIIGFVFFSFFRSFLFGASFSFLPTLVDGPVIGLGAGMMTGLGGLVSFVNIPLASIAINQLDGDFFWPNLFYVGVNGLCILAVAGLGRYMDTDEDEGGEGKDEKEDDDSSE